MDGFQHNISLTVDEKLSKGWAFLFLKTVRKTGPDDIWAPVQIYDKVGEEKQLPFKHKKNKDGSHSYIVPLKRDLVEKEAEKIVWCWSQVFEGDFIIETSTAYTKKEVTLEPKEEKKSKTEERITQEAKFRHNRWVENKVDQGWRFGPELSIVEKTHPMLRSWDDLPDAFKKAKGFGSILSGIIN